MSDHDSSSSSKDEPTPEQRANVRRIGAMLHETRMAAQRNDAAVVAEAWSVWDRDADKIADTLNAQQAEYEASKAAGEKNNAGT